MATGRRETLIGLGSLGAALAAGACRGAPRNRARPDLYHCEGCEAALERPASSPYWDVDVARGEPGEPLWLEGRVTMPDGRTPAANVIIYLHQANNRGLYANGSSRTVWGRRHGRLHAWVKTDRQGRYRFRTIKPAPYPSRTMPAHIHLYLVEPGRRPYYIDDVVFEGEFKVDEAYRARQELRGGSGIVRLTQNPAGRWRAVRNIRLERHP